MDFHELLENFNLKEFEVDYCDLRIEKVLETKIQYRDGELKDATESPTCGAFLRVLKNGNWAYKSTTKLDQLRDEFLSLVRNVELLPAKKDVNWPTRESRRYENKYYEKTGAQCFNLEQKRALCEKLLPVLSANAKVNGPMVVYKDMYKQKWFKASDDVSFYFDYSQMGGGVSYTLRDGEDSFQDRVSFYVADPVKDSDKVLKKLEDALKEGEAFIKAPSIEPGKYTVVLDQGVTGVFTHESFGHKSEADFMLGDEKMKEEWKIGNKVASDILNIVDDGNWPDTSGFVPIDDEGNLKQKTYLIKDGKLAGRLHSTMTALSLDEAPTGNARAMNFEYEPIVRMTNTYIEKGDKTFNEMISKIKKGVYLKGYKHGMGMSTFTIAPQKAYMIEDGKLASPVNVSVLSGNVFETLNKIVDLGSDFDIHSGATGGCGKMEQWPLPVADGGPSIVVEDMTLS